MHHIEPFYRWTDEYVAAEDPLSPFYGRKYSQFYETNKLYNFFLHPDWDGFGSSTLYAKILYADYGQHFALIELIGEWNDTLHNDIMELKRNVIDHMMAKGIYKFVFFCENVLNFHAGDDDYYQEWAEEMQDVDGWAVLINLRPHVEEEMDSLRLNHYLVMGDAYNEVNWRIHKPEIIFKLLEAVVNGKVKRIFG